uniref:Capsid protein n=1 Tax=Antarctic circular DNA molecule TaxID=2664238 RepID=A0A5Q2F2B2_9ZZZZ|nr:hypothetical protein [Antarctic circular DNA molecule]
MQSKRKSQSKLPYAKYARTAYDVARGAKKVYDKYRKAKKTVNNLIPKTRFQQEGTHGDAVSKKITIEYPGQHKKRHDEGKFEVFTTYTGRFSSSNTGIVGYMPYSASDLNFAGGNPILIPPLFTLRQILFIPAFSAGVRTFTPNTIFQSRTPVLSGSSIFEINPDTNNSGSTMIPLATGAETFGAGQQRIMHLKSVKDNIVFTNFSNVSARIKIVWFLCKKSTTFTPIELMDQSMENRRPPGTVTNATEVFGTSVANVMGPGFLPTTGFQLRTIGHEGFDLSNFPLAKKYWKVLNTEQFILQGGDHYEMITKTDVNKYIQKETLVTSEIDNSFHAGLTCIPTVFIAPYPVTDTTSAGIAMSDVTIGPFNIGAVTTRNWEFGWVSKNISSDMQYVQPGLAINPISASTKLVNTEDASVPAF